MQIQSYIPSDLRTGIRRGNVDEVEKIVKSGFDPNCNLYENRYITPVIYALGCGSLPVLEKGEKPIDLRSAKKIVKILQDYGANNLFDEKQALEFIKAMNFATRSAYLGSEGIVVASMKKLLNEINAAQKTFKNCHLFVFGLNDFKILPKELAKLIALDLYHSVNKFFD